MNAFQKNNSALVSDPDSLEALLQYHVATGVHPSLNFGPPAIFAPTLLTNPNFTNVTGGQRIELTTGNGSPLVLTGLKAPSHITDKVSISLYRSFYDLISIGHPLCSWYGSSG